MTTGKTGLTVRDLTAAQFFLRHKDGQRYMFRRIEGEKAICSPTEEPTKMVAIPIDEKVQLLDRPY